MKKAFLLCKPYILSHKIAMSLYIFLSFLLIFQSLATPYISGNFIDVLILGGDTSIVFAYCGLFALFALSGQILTYFSNRLHIKIQTTISYELNRNLLQHLQKVRLTYFHDKDSSILNQRINSDSNTLVAFCVSFFQNVSINLFTLILAVIVVGVFDALIALVLAVLIPCYLLVYKKFKKILFESGYDLKKTQSEYFGKLYEQLAFIKQVKIFSLFSIFTDRLNNTFNSTLNAALRYQKASFQFSALDTAIFSVAQMFLFIYGGIRVIEGKLSVGNFTIISSYFSMMLSSVRYFFSLGKTLQDTEVSCNRLFQILDVPIEKIGEQRFSKIDSIELKHVSISFQKKSVLSDTSLVFRKGNTYIIKGANGAGKSTLINIILGLYADEFEGDILFNGMPISYVNMYDLRKEHIGVSEQEPILFEDTIRYNFELGRTVDNNLLLRLFDILDMGSFLSSLPNGMETIIGEKSANLSGGEKQKIALVRALIKNPDVLILDEPTSALDSVCTANLISYLKSIQKDKIIILITHDYRLEESTDTIVSL